MKTLYLISWQEPGVDRTEYTSYAAGNTLQEATTAFKNMHPDSLITDMTVMGEVAILIER